jgi:hypothetical protein
MKLWAGLSLLFALLFVEMGALIKAASTMVPSRSITSGMFA